MLADLGYDPDPAPTDEAPAEEFPARDGASAVTDALGVLGALGRAALDNPDAVVGLLAGAGLASVGVATVTAGGTVTVGSGGTLAVAGIPAVGAGIGPAGIGGALMVAAADKLAKATAAESAGPRTTSSVNQAQKQVERRNAPKSIDRFDKGDPQMTEQPHVHFKDGNALNQDGTWKHGPGRPLASKEKKFLEGYGWRIPE